MCDIQGIALKFSLITFTSCNSIKFHVKYNNGYFHIHVIQFDVENAGLGLD